MDGTGQGHQREFGCGDFHKVRKLPDLAGRAWPNDDHHLIVNSGMT
jgi:hypothetical protein